MKIKSGWLWMVLTPAVSFGWGDDCDHSAERAAGIEASGVDKVVIRAGAGDMKVVGRASAVRVEARGVACAARKELLDATLISVRREGNVVIVETTLPDNLAGWTLGKNEYAYIDLGVALPANLPVEVLDSSGDSKFEDLRQLTLQDSSGDLEVRRIAGLADISDSSGDIAIEEAGSVRVRDSSGDMELRAVRGDVDIELDSSGDIRVDDVDGSVRVRQDSSGSIRVGGVKGNVDVDSDSSGDIEASRVTGNFTVSEDSSGSIDHSEIGGKVSIPPNKRDDVE
jgi:DUF4097 and DUF4098 domain-containing protein YvlB